MIDECFETIYDKTYKSILKYVISKCSDLQYVEDIMQNIYLNLFNTMQRKKNYIENYDAFIFTIAKREVIKYYGLKAKMKMFFDNVDFSIIEKTVPSPVLIEVDFITKENKDLIWEAIKKESIETQKIMVLHYLEGVSMKEIAQLLGINENTVKTKIYRTISKLKGKYGEHNE